MPLRRELARIMHKAVPVAAGPVVGTSMSPIGARARSGSGGKSGTTAGHHRLRNSSYEGSSLVVWLSPLSRTAAELRIGCTQDIDVDVPTPPPAHVVTTPRETEVWATSVSRKRGVSEARLGIQRAESRPEHPNGVGSGRPKATTCGSLGRAAPAGATAARSACAGPQHYGGGAYPLPRH
jgi:hypothetical protein